MVTTVERERGLIWVPGPEGGIMSQPFVAAVVSILPDDLLMRRWVFIRWQGTPTDDIAEHFCAEASEVRAALCAARDMLQDQEEQLLDVLIPEEHEVLSCLRNSLPSGSQPPVTRYATWKDERLGKGEASRTPAMPRIREDIPANAAYSRLCRLLRLLGE